MTDPVEGPGRPSKYDAAFCAAVIEHMSDGASLTSFAADIGVARSTINEWMGNYPEFSEAVNIAKAKCAAWWELQGRTLATAGGGNATLVIFGLKNMAGEDWRDKHDHEHSGTVQVTGVQYTVVDPAKPEG
jgi:transposase